MFGLSGEHIIILVIILVIFGPRKLPELGVTLGKAIKNFKDSVNGVQEVKYRKIDDEPVTGDSKKTEEKVAAGTKSSSDSDPTKKS